jgi:hypothetical protein
MRKSILSKVIMGSMSAAVLATTPTPAFAQAQRVIAIRNDCRHPIEFIIHHADSGNNQHHPHAWYSLDAYSDTDTFQDNGVILRQLDGRTLYFYAQTTNGTGIYWQGSGPAVNWGGARFRTMPMNTSVDDQGRLFARVTCPGR